MLKHYLLHIVHKDLYVHIHNLNRYDRHYLKYSWYLLYCIIAYCTYIYILYCILFW